MKDRITKILQMTASVKWIAVVAVVCFIGIMIPLIRLCFYSVPWSDDYNYGRFAKNFMDSEGASLKSLWEGAVYCTRTSWYAWQGTFSSIFLMSIVPCVFGEQYYFIGTLGILLFFTCAVISFAKVLSRNLLQADKASQAIYAAAAAASLIVLIYSSQQGIYWYNAAVHYTFMHGCMLLMIAGAVKLFFCKGIGGKVGVLCGISFLAFVCGGSNYVSALQGMLFLLTVMGIGMLCRKRQSLLLLIPAVVYGIAFYYNASAPGNAVRAANFQGMNAIQAILHSLKSAFLDIPRYMGWMMPLVMLLLVPVIWNNVSKIRFSFPLPGIVLLLSFGLYATGYTPNYYSMGTVTLERVLTVVKFTFQILLIINEIYVIGWLQRKLPAGVKNKECRHYFLFYAILGIAMIAVVKTAPNQAGCYSSYGAYYYIKSGEADNFYTQYLDRVEKLHGEEAVVELAPYEWKPWMLCIEDLSPDPTYVKNTEMARWYGKEAIYCKAD